LPEIVADSEDELLQILKQKYGIDDPDIDYLTSFSHTFSHYHLQLQPIRIKATPSLLADSDSQWCSVSTAQDLGLPTAMKKLLAML
jgi:A/G-specific adenine glycosylase